MSINWKKSAELNHCSIVKLKIWFEKHPKSHKQIVAVCDGYDCSRERKIEFRQYRDLCVSCSLLKRFEDPKEHEKLTVTHKKRYEDDVTLTQKNSKRMTKLYEDPKEREKQSIVHFKLYEDPKEREKISIGNKRRYEDPKEHEKTSISIKRSYAKLDDPGQQLVNHHVAYDFNNPEALTVEITRSFHGSIHHPKGQGIHERGYSLID